MQRPRAAGPAGGTERGRETVCGEHDGAGGDAGQDPAGLSDGAEQLPSKGSSDHQTPTPIHSQGIS